MRRIIGLVAALSLGAGSAFAQSDPPPPPPPPAPPPSPPAPPARLRAPTPLREHMYMMRGPGDSAYANRPTLGMTLTATGSKRDTLGVFVSRVAPGGPAERAGIIEGDRIAAIGDASLALSASDLDDPYMMGMPAHKVSRAVSKISVGGNVVLRVWSSGKFRNVTVTAGRMGDVYKERSRNMMFSFNDGDFDGFARMGAAFERMGPELERIGPEVQLQVERAMRSLPRDMHFRVDFDSSATKR